jgi:transposase
MTLGVEDPAQETDSRRLRNYRVSHPLCGKDEWQCLIHCDAAAGCFKEVDLMEALVERCCGLDVHQETVVACLLVGRAGERPIRRVQTFGTVKRELERLRDWLNAEGCAQVAMESTGVYWMPVYAVLEEHFQVIVGNATHIKNVPGRKTDVKDAEWIADLLRHGLIKRSFVPPKPLRDLRDLLRYRRKLIESQTSERNRLLRLLETADIKIACVMTNVFGVSGRKMLEALLAGDLTAEQMAELARGRLRKKVSALAAALDGRVEEHHKFLLRLQLERIDQVDDAVARLDGRIDEKLEPYKEQRDRLMKIPGVDRIGAAVIIAEMGIDMSVFPTVAHAAAWAGVSPGNNESAGKRKAQPGRKGNVHLTTALVQAAVCAARTKGTFLRDRYWRLKARRGPLRAALAVAHKILIAAYHMLSRGVEFKELGAEYLDRRAATFMKNAAVKRLRQLGYVVHLEVAPSPA